LAWPSAVVSIIALVSIVICIDPAGSYPNMPEGPGLTVDEIFNVEQGVLLVERARSLGWLLLVPSTSLEAFKPANGYLPDHPPLGRYWLGIHHHFTWWLAAPHDPEANSCVTACARTGSATAFALTVFLIGTISAKWFGRLAGLSASLALMMMPRVYGHAHLASLETVTNLTCTAAVLVVAERWNDVAPPSRRIAFWTGVVMGLALLTKIQAILIPIPLVIWACGRWRLRATVPLLVWGFTAVCVFFVGWPYLWLDPVGHFQEYLGRTSYRATIFCWYFGERYPDKFVPWHYPFVLFGLTIPIGLHLFGVLGVYRRGDENSSARSSLTITHQKTRSLKNTVATQQIPSPIGRMWQADNRSRSRDRLLLAFTLFPMIVFAVPGVAVYDGERLFLTSFPLWAIFVGRGISESYKLLLRLPYGQTMAPVAWSGMVMLQATSLISMHPYHIAYYNPIVHALESTGKPLQEVDYWGVGVTRGLIQKMVHQIPPGSVVGIAPTLHQFQADDYRRQSPILRKHDIKTVSFDALQAPPEFGLAFRRLADLPDLIAEADSPVVELANTRLNSRILAFVTRRNITKR
jgi:hypothetical protein